MYKIRARRENVYWRTQTIVERRWQLGGWVLDISLAFFLSSFQNENLKEIFEDQKIIGTRTGRNSEVLATRR